MDAWKILRKPREDCNIEELKKKRKLCQYLSILLAVEAMLFLLVAALFYLKLWKITATMFLIIGMSYAIFFFLEVAERNQFSMWIYLKRKLGE